MKPRTPQQLEGRVAVVTGASSGIGRALALALGRAGIAVVLGGRKAEALASAREELEAAGATARSLVGDVRDEEHLVQLLATAQDLGGLDLMVNNAGVQHPGPVLEGDTDAWREMLETNLLAVCVGSRLAARAMQGRGGVLVNVSSLAGLEPTPSDAVYSATKHGVTAFSHALRAELAPGGTHVLVVHPGQTMTSIGRSLDAQRMREMAASLGLDPRDVPDFQGGHAPEPLRRAVLKAAPHVFLDPDVVAARIVEALCSSPVPAELTIRPPS